MALQGRKAAGNGVDGVQPRGVQCHVGNRAASGGAGPNRETSNYPEAPTRDDDGLTYRIQRAEVKRYREDRLVKFRIGAPAMRTTRDRWPDLRGGDGGWRFCSPAEPPPWRRRKARRRPSSSRPFAPAIQPSSRRAPASSSAGTSATVPATSCGATSARRTPPGSTAPEALRYCLSKMRTGPDGYKGWVGEDQTGRGTWADNHVGDAIIVDPMLGFAEVVLKDPELKKKYGEAAEKYVAEAKRDLFEKWDKRGTWKEDRAWGCYIGWDMVCCRPHPDTWKKDIAPSIAEPFNKNNHMGICSLRLFRITGEEKYRDRAFKIFAYTKSRFQLVDEHLQLLRLELLGAFGPESVDLAKHDTRLWMNVHGGRPYNAGEIGQMVEAYNTGVVFDKTDIERFLNTNLKVMWNGDKAKPHFSIANWKLPMPNGPDGKPLPLETNSPGAQLWSGLAQFSQTIRDLGAARTRAGETSERPKISFDRLYCAEKDAKVFDWPYYHSLPEPDRRGGPAQRRQEGQLDHHSLQGPHPAGPLRDRPLQRGRQGEDPGNPSWSDPRRHRWPRRNLHPPVGPGNEPAPAAERRLPHPLDRRGRLPRVPGYGHGIAGRAATIVAGENRLRALPQSRALALAARGRWLAVRQQSVKPFQERIRKRVHVL